MNIVSTSLTSQQESWRKAQSTLIYKTLYFSVLIVRSPCQATLGSSYPSGAVGKMPKPHTSCHKGKPGNEAAELAKAAATDTPPQPMSLATTKALIRRTIIRTIIRRTILRIPRPTGPEQPRCTNLLLEGRLHRNLQQNRCCSPSPPTTRTHCISRRMPTC